MDHGRRCANSASTRRRFGACGYLPTMPSAGVADLLFLPELREKAYRSSAVNLRVRSGVALFLQYRAAHYLLSGDWLLAGSEIYAIRRPENEADRDHRAHPSACFFGHHFLDWYHLDTKHYFVSDLGGAQYRWFLRIREGC